MRRERNVAPAGALGIVGGVGPGVSLRSTPGYRMTPLPGLRQVTNRCHAVSEDPFQHNWVSGGAPLAPDGALGIIGDAGAGVSLRFTPGY
jgi:hypothetical protein